MMNPYRENIQISSCNFKITKLTLLQKIYKKIKCTFFGHKFFYKTLDNNWIHHNNFELTMSLFETENEILGYCHNCNKITNERLRAAFNKKALKQFDNNIHHVSFVFK